MKTIKSFLLLLMLALAADGFAQASSDNDSSDKSLMLAERESKKAQILRLSSEDRELTASEKETKLASMKEREAKKKAFLESQSINRSSRPLTNTELKAIRA